jgi:hypothetical protein
MKRISMMVFAVLVFAAAACGAETLFLGKERLVSDPADPSVVTFAVDVAQPGSYQVRLLAQGEPKREVRLELALRPEAGGQVQTVHFSFTGQGCG